MGVASGKLMEAEGELGVVIGGGDLNFVEGVVAVEVDALVRVVRGGDDLRIYFHASAKGLVCETERCS